MRAADAIPSSDSPSPGEPDVTTVSRLRFALFALIIIVLIGLCTLIAYPFLPAITWSAALAVIALPLHRWIERRVHRRGLAALLSTAAVVLLLLIPTMSLVVHLAKQTTTAAEQVKDVQRNGGVRSLVEKVPQAKEALARINQAGVDVEAKVREAIAARAQGVSDLMQGSLAAIAQFLVTVFIPYYLLRDRAKFIQVLRDLLPLSRSQSDRVLECAADSVHAGVYATFITSLIDSVGSGLIFWYVGLPAPLMWAAVMFVLAFLPVAGAGLVWFPAAIYLATSGHLGGGALVLSWGVLTFIFVDNILYFRMVGDRLRMHPVQALVAFLGGIAVFGMSGMVLGPAILAVTMAFREVWQDRVCSEDASEAGVQPRIVRARTS